jgi:hypothetical protein
LEKMLDKRIERRYIGIVKKEPLAPNTNDRTQKETQMSETTVSVRPYKKNLFGNDSSARVRVWDRMLDDGTGFEVNVTRGGFSDAEAEAITSGAEFLHRNPAAVSCVVFESFELVVTARRS